MERIRFIDHFVVNGGRVLGILGTELSLNYCITIYYESVNHTLLIHTWLIVFVISLLHLGIGAPRNPSTTESRAQFYALSKLLSRLSIQKVSDLSC